MTRGKVVAGLAAAVALSGLAFAQDAKVERGKAVYVEQKCKICHSIAAEGNAKGSLDGVGTKLKAEEIKEWLANPKAMAEKSKAERKPPMKAFASLPAADADALVAYLASLKK